jgi:hypothetical protein
MPLRPCFVITFSTYIQNVKKIRDIYVHLRFSVRWVANDNLKKKTVTGMLSIVCTKKSSWISAKISLQVWVVFFAYLLILPE